MALNITIVIAIAVLGIIFMLIEIFLLPGISIAGIAGAALIVGAVAYAYIFLGSTAGTIALISSLAVLAIAFIWLVKSRSLQRIGLKTNIEGTVDKSDLLKIKAGEKGVTISRLNPIGKIMVNETIIEGKSIDGSFIDEDIEIEVVKIEIYNALVKQVIK